MHHSVYLLWIYFSKLVFAGIYHVFLLIKDGFFHITNLALVKIQNGKRHFYIHKMYEMICDLTGLSLVFTLIALTTMDLETLKEVCEVICDYWTRNIPWGQNPNRVSHFQVQSCIKIDFCSTKEFHEEGCSTAVVFTLNSDIHLMVGVSVLHL